MNRVSLCGRLTADPKVGTSKNGKEYALFSIACKDNYNFEEVIYFSCVAWNNKYVVEYLKKGSSVTIDGHFSQKKIDLDNGKYHNCLQVVVDMIECHTFKNSDEDGSVAEIIPQPPKEKPVKENVHLGDVFNEQNN